MIIYSEKNSYTLAHSLENSNRSFIAADKGGEEYIVLSADSALARSLTPLLIEFGESLEFTDFKEYFPFEDKLYIVFKNRPFRREAPLVNAAPNMPQRLRVKAVRSMLGLFMAQLTPFPVIYDVLISGNALCSPSGDVRLQYNLSLNESYGQNAKDKAMLALAESLAQIFTGIGSPALDNFLFKLTARELNNMEDVYAEFSLISKELEALQAAVEVEISLKARLDYFISAALQMIPHILKGIAVAGCIILLAYSFYTNVISPPPVDNGIKKIGTVIVYEGLY